MLVPWSWLAECTALDIDPLELCSVLTQAGLETEIATDERPTWDGVVTARLDAVEPHPGADKLTVTRANDGTTVHDVVCGASNHRTGDIVALATTGTRLPNGLKIKRSKIRGAVSAGMLCSTTELGLGGDASGILILPADTPVGVPLADVYAAGDVILEVSPTANRGDCQSMIGLAREVAAVLGATRTLRAPEPATAPTGAQATAGVGEHAVDVRIDAPAGCPRYAAAVMTGVEIGPSPDWMQRRLEACGVRAINNVVDCTNYVMLELGQPLHAFDRRFLRGGIHIRWAAAGEPLVTLDEGKHVLEADDLLIADDEGGVALAGVMGGANSEVRDDTTVLVLESAHFAPDAVRRTAHRTRLSTEASYRFARGVDPELPPRALARLMELLEQTAGATTVGPVADLYPAPVVPLPVDLRLERVAGLLGLDLTAERVAELLDRAGLHPEPVAGGVLRVQPPTHRFDIEREVDLLEEVARLNGYDAIPEVLPSRPVRVVPRRWDGLDRDALRGAMARWGLSEAIHFSFIDPGWVEQLGVGEDHPWRSRVVEVSNPLSEVGRVLRPTLLPSLLRAAARNRAMGSADVRLYELRTVFQTRPDGFAEILAGRDGRPLDRTPVLERESLAAVLLGRRAAPGWAAPDDTVDLHDVQAVAAAVLPALRAAGWSWRPAEPGTHPWLAGHECAVLVDGSGRRTAGWVGRIAVPVLRAYELDTVCWALELDVDMLRPKRLKVPQFTAFSRFPMVERDLAFSVPDGIAAGWVLQTAERTGRKALKDAFLGVELFDVYRGTGVADGQRSLGVRARFRAKDRTLEDRAVDAAMAQIEAAVCKGDGVALRA